MAYTETTSSGWFSRLGSSFSGMGMGLVLIIAGTVLLWWNEGDFVATRDALNETQGITQKVTDISGIDPSLNGKVIHAVGFADTQDVLRDPVFQVGDRAVALRTEVEFYQWVEESTQEKRKKLGGGEETVTTYTYTQAWVSAPVNSDTFADPDARSRHVNTVHMALEAFAAQAANVTFGAYRLPGFLIGSINKFEPMQVEPAPEVRDELKRRIQAARSSRPGRQVAGNFPGGYASSLSPVPSADVRPIDVVAQGNTIYIGPSAAVPTVGDVRVTFKKTAPSTVSLIAKVAGDTFEPYYASNGEMVSRLTMGTVSMEAMYGRAHSSNSTWTWVFRALGTALIIMGLKMLAAPLVVVADVIPLLGSIVGAGTGLVCTLLGLAWSLIVVSVAWLRFRPLIGGIMLGVALILIVLLFIKGRTKKAVQPAAA